MYFIYFYVPATHVDSVKQAIFAKGAGRMGAYDSCAWQCVGQGQFRPLSGSQPAIGTLNQLEFIDELKVETVCHPEHLDAVLNALLKAHPYELPAYGYFPIHQQHPLMSPTVN